MLKNNNAKNRTLGIFSKLVLAILLTGLISGLQPLPRAHGIQGASPDGGVSIPDNQAVSASAVEHPVTGETIVVEPAGTATWQDMLDYEANHPVEPQPPTVIPYMPPPPPLELGEVGENPAPVDIRPAAPIVDPLAPPGLVNDFLGLDDNNASIPPDTMGAAGPNHLVVMLNTQVRIQSKTGGTLSTVNLDTFWTGGTGLSGDPFDPKVVFDSLSGRWMATVDVDGELTTSAVWFAISATSDPTGSWTFYGIDADPGDTYWADYPGFGMNSTWIAITNNMFTNAGNIFSGAKMWVIDKSTALAGGALTISIFPIDFDLAGGASGFTLQPALTFDAAELKLYILDNSGFSSGGTFLLRLSQIAGTGAEPVWSVVAGSPFGGSGLFFVANNFNFLQIDADQLGTTTKVNTNNPRLLNAVLRNGRLWTTHSAGLPVGGSDRTAVFWYEIDPTAMPTPIVQSGVVENGAGTHFFFPSIAVNANNDVALGFSYSDATQYVEAAYTGRESTDAAGTMGAATTCKAGEDSYVKDYGYGRVRWGDYSATVVDPTDDLTFWTLQEYAETDVGAGESDDRWGTWWCRAQVGNIWQGDDLTNPTFWNDPDNWSAGAVPTCSTDAIIPAAPSGGYFPTVSTAAAVRNLTIGAGATLDLDATTLTVCGNMDNSGAFNSTGGTVDFNGGIIQNLTANVATGFTNLTVSGGTTLVETATADNVSVSGLLTNNGTIRKSRFSLGTGSTTFGLTGASIDVSTLGNLATLQVDRVGSANPNENYGGGGAYILDTYYALTPNASPGTFSLEVCLGYTEAELLASAVTNEAGLRLCRWTGGGWICPNRSGNSSTGTNTACAANVDALSDWTIGEVGPTAVTLKNLGTRVSGAGSRGIQLVLSGLVIFGGLTIAGFVRRRRRMADRFGRIDND